METELYELRTVTGEVIAWIQSRPHYCDRGRYHACIAAAGIWVSDADPWPRYYFKLHYAKGEVVAWLAAKGVVLAKGATWRKASIVHSEATTLAFEGRTAR